MTYFGQAMKVLFYPMRLITVPLVWLFKHRCELDSQGACKGLFCETGKVGVPGWSSAHHGSEWVYYKPLPTVAADSLPSDENLLGELVVNSVPIYINKNASSHHAKIAAALANRGLTVIHKD